MEQIHKTAMTMRNSCVSKSHADAGELREYFEIYVMMTDE